MTRSRLFPSLVLLAVFLAACASATPSAAPVEPTVTLSPVAEVTPAVGVTATFLHEMQSVTPPAETVPVATSRGPDLQATDPGTVNLASGGLQLVEFFRFT